MVNDKMKASFALSAFSLSHFAQAFQAGTYIIGSAALPPSLVLTERNPTDALAFSQQEGEPTQSWNFISTHDGFFEIQNNIGSNIACNGDEGSLCFPGDQPQGFLPEFRGGKNYELVAEGSGLFLRVNQNQDLYLAGWDQSLEEQFVLTSVDQ